MTHTPDLPRQKPDPLPRVITVPENQASGRLLAAYDATKAGLNVPWMGVVTMAFAQFPSFYDVLWSGIDPIVRSAEFAQACDDLRACAESEAEALVLANLVGPMKSLGYTPPDFDDIRHVVEVFSRGNIPYLLLATMARLLLEGGALSAKAQAATACRDLPETQLRPLVLMEAHHAGCQTRAVYDSIRQTLGLPFVNTDYRALARWPSYFAAAWRDLQPNVGTKVYDEAVTCVHRKAVALVSNLPNPAGLTSESLIAAARADGDLDRTLDTVRLFQWLLPGLIVNVAGFRRQLSDAGWITGY